MAQTGYTPILIYSSSTAAAAPTAGNLTNSTLGSELAINIADGKLFYKDSGGSVQVIGWKTVPISAGGTGLTSYTAGDLIYYASGTAFTKLAIGSAYQALQVNAGGTAPSWQPSASSVLTAQGDLLYASAANTLARLAKNTTATRYLANTGTTNNPQWDQINLANGVTGTLPTGNGGTGLTSFTANGIVYASSTSALATGSALTFDGTNIATTGNFVVSTSGKGIDFSANSHAAGMTSELLTWYEEGTWTPTYTQTSLSGVTYLNRVGNYTRIGRAVFITFNLTTTGTFTVGTGAVTVTGLPFTSKSDNTSHVGFANATRWNTAPVSGQIGGSTTTINIFSTYNGTGPGTDPVNISGTNILSTDGGNNNILRGSALYFV